MANREQLKRLRQGVEGWNRWRKEHPDERIDLGEARLSGANLRGANLRGAWLSDARLSNADLRDAELEGADLSRAMMANANLGKANLRDAHLGWASLGDACLEEAQAEGADFFKAYLAKAKLSWANLKKAILIQADLAEASLLEAHLEGAFLERAQLAKANLRGAYLTGAVLTSTYLWEADLSHADLRGAHLDGADLWQATLTEADLRAASLTGSVLVGTRLEKANLGGCRVYGISAWDVHLDETIQTGLLISPEGSSEITVDDLEVAQFIYLLLTSRKIRNVIHTVTSKAVLILGRFSERQKPVLDALHAALRDSYGMVPILFDWEPSEDRDLTETVLLLANMCRFIIADMTDAKSIPQELSHIVPNLPSVPVQPIILATEHEYAMFEHWRKFPAVLPEYRYEGQQQLLDTLGTGVLAPIERWEEATDKAAAKERQMRDEIEAQLGEIAKLKQQLAEARKTKLTQWPTR